MYFEEFYVGQAFPLEPVVVTKEDILAFARPFDPQRIHVDESFAAKGPYGGLIASGYHTLSVVWSQWIKADVLGDQSLGGLGLDRVVWSAPVRPGDQLSTTVAVARVRKSSNLVRGIVSFHFDVQNQDDVTVMVTDGVALVQRRSG